MCVLSANCVCVCGIDNLTQSTNQICQGLKIRSLPFHPVGCVHFHPTSLLESGQLSIYPGRGNPRPGTSLVFRIYRYNCVGTLFSALEHIYWHSKVRIQVQLFCKVDFMLTFIAFLGPNWIVQHGGFSFIPSVLMI